MLFLDGVYVDDANGSTRFRWVRAPSGAELTKLAHRIAHRVGRFLERHGLLERDAENGYLATDAVNEDPMNTLLGHSITYRIAVGPHQGRKVYTLQTLPACDESFGVAATATGYRLAWRGELAGERANDRNLFRSARLIQARFRYEQAGKQW